MAVPAYMAPVAMPTAMPAQVPMVQSVVMAPVGMERSVATPIAPVAQAAPLSGPPYVVDRDMDWDKLPPQNRSSWEALGWSDWRWEKGSKPDTEDLDWHELSGTQRQAASALGYTQGVWDSS